MLTLYDQRISYILSESIFCFRTLNLDVPALADVMPLLHRNCTFDAEMYSALIDIQDDIEVPPEIQEWVKDKPKPNLDQATSFNLGTLESPKLIQIGSDLTPNQRNDMFTLLTQF